MAQQIDIVANLLMKVDGAEAGINKLKNSLSKLKMPEGLENSFKKSFANLDTLFARYKSQVEKGFNTKGDVTAFNKTSKALDAELTRISKHFTELTGKEINFKVKSDDIIRTEKELEKLIEQKAQLSKESLKFEIKGGKDGFKDIESILLKLKEAAGRTKTGENIGGALDFLKTGDVQTAISLLEKASVSVKRFKQEKQDAFKSETGFDMSNILATMISMLSGTEGKFGDVNAKITETKNNLTSFQAEQLQKAGNYAEELSSKMEDSASEIRKADGAMQDFARSSQSMSQQLGDLQQSTQYFFSLRNMINLLKRGLSEAVQTVKDLDAAMTETAVVTDFSVGDMWAKLPEYTANANKLGATIQDMYESTTLYYQQGLNTQQAMSIATETMKMARIAGLEAKDATDMMTAALRGFNMELNENSATRINDVYSNLAAKTASDTKEIGTAMQRTASIAHSAGMSFEGTAAFLAQAIETTREPAENIGTAMKTIVARFQEMKKNPLEIAEVDGEEVSYNKVDAALQSIGVSLKDTNGQFRELDKVFLDISKKWDGLSQTQQRYIATIAAGSRQQSRFIAMMSDYDRTVELMSYANDSAGASQEQFNKTLDSLEAKLNKFQNAWKEFLMGIMNDSWVKGIVDAGTKVLSTVNNIIDALSGGGKLKGVKSILSLFTAFTALKGGGNIINKLIGGLGGLVDPTSSFSKGFFGAGKTTAEGTPATGVAGKITTPIVAKLNELIAVTKGNKDNQIKQTSTVDQYKATNQALRKINGMDMGTISALFGGLSEEQAYTAYKNAPGTADAMKQASLGWLGSKKMPADAQKTGQQLMNAIFKGMSKKEISVQDGMKLLGQPQKWGQQFGTDVAWNFSNSFSKQLTSQAHENTLYGLGLDPKEYAVGSSAFKTLLKNDKELQDAYIRNFRDWRDTLEQEETASFGNAPVVQTGFQQFANKIGSVGSAFSTAGMSLQMFGAQLGQLSPVLQGIGNLLSQVGMAVNTFGMGISGVGGIITKIGGRIAAGKAAVSAGGFAMSQAVASGAIAAESTVAATGTSAASAFVSGFTGGMSAGPIAAIIGAVVVGAFALIKGHLDKKAREAGEEVRNNFEQGFTETNKKIDAISDYKDRFNELAQGVDQFGHNVSLSDEDYDEYLSISRELQQLSPSLIAGYNAEGQAILRKGEALDEVINKLKEERDLSLSEYIDNDSIDKLIGEYNTSDAYKSHHTRVKDTASQYTTVGAFDTEKSSISKALKQAELEWSDFSQILDELGIGGAASIDQLTNRQLSLISEHYTDVLNKVKEFNPQIEEEAEEGLKEAFAKTNNAIEEVLTEGAPIVDALKQWMGQEKLDAVGLNLSEEFVSGFNSGLEGLMLEGLTNKWTPEEYKAQIKDYANEWKQLAGPTSEYNKILTEADKIQQDYLDHIGEDGAIENYKDNIEDSAQKLINLANNTDTATEAGQAFAEQCTAQANALRNYATEGALSLGEALNQLSSKFAEARNAKERFDEAVEGGDYYTAAEDYRSIAETVMDEKNWAGDGSLTGWAGAEELLGRAYVDTHSWEDIKGQIKEVNKLFDEGIEGVYNFNDMLVEAWKNGKIQDMGKVTDGKFKFDFENVENLKAWAEELEISEGVLSAMIDKSRQFAAFNVGNNKEIRRALEQTNEAMIGKTPTSGKSALYVSESYFYEEARKQGIRGDDYTKTKTDLEKEQNIKFLTVESLSAKEGFDSFFEDIGFSGADKTLDNVVNVLSRMGFDLEDTKRILNSDGVQLQDGAVSDEAIEKAYKEQEFEVENPTVAGIADDTGVIANAATAMLAQMGIMTEQAKKDIENNTSNDTIKGYTDLLGQNFTNVQDREAARASAQAKRDEYQRTIDLYAEGGLNEDNNEYIKRLVEARNQLDAALANEANSWHEKISEYSGLFDNISDKFVSEHTADYASAFAIDDIMQSAEALRQLNDEGHLSYESIRTLAAEFMQLHQAELMQFDSTQLDELATKLGLTKDEAIGLLSALDVPFALEGRLTGDDLVTYIQNFEGLTDSEKTIFLRTDISGEEKAELLIDKINNEFGDGDETTKSVIIQATTALANGDQAGAEKILADAGFKDGEVQEITQKLSILVDGSVANPDEVKAALQKELNSLQISTNVKANISTNIGKIGTKVNVDTGAIDDAKNKADSTTGTMTVDANTQKAQDKINKLRDIKDASITVNAKKGTGWTQTMSVKLGHARGRNYSIPAHQSLSFGAAASGFNTSKSHKSSGPKVTALVGEEGFEVGYIPSQARSLIFGANGPEITSFPKDTIIYPHKQSKEIVRRGKGKTPTMGSFISGTLPSRVSVTSYSSSGSSKSKNSGGSKSSSSSNNKKTINNFSLEEVIRFDIDQTLAKLNSDINKKAKEIEKSLTKIGGVYDDIVDSVNTQIQALQQVKTNNQALVDSYIRQLKAIDEGTYEQSISWTDSNGDSQEAVYNLSKYIYKDAAGTYKVDYDKIKALGSNAEREAVFKAANSAISSLQSGLLKAQEAVDNANEKMAELGKKVSETFYQWENELTEIYDLTQRINDETSFTNRFVSQVELELSKLNAGFGQTEKAIENTRKVLTRNNDTIQRQIADQKQMIAARQRELNLMLSAADEQEKLNKYQNMTDIDEATKTANIEWAQDKVTVAETALKYVANVFRDLDGSVTYEIDWASFNADNDQSPMNKETYAAVKKYLDDLNSAATEFNNSVKEQTDFIKQTYDALRQYQDHIVDMESTLVKGVEEQIENAKNNAKALSDSITNALKDLLDEVKRKLDERRKQEDNAKTERDIAQKQQRLAALRANTSGGNQVEIAQLEKEIADAQQSYGRTLEDQLLDRLQQQGDEAAKQRERQIELMEISNRTEASTNQELVDMWLKNPQAYKDKIKEAWLEAQGYADKGEAGQYVLDNEFESKFTELITAVEQSGFNNLEAPFTAIEGNTNTLVALLQKLTSEENNAVQDATERNTEILKDLTKDVEGAKKAYSKGVDAKTLKDKFGFDATILAGGGYTPSDLRRAGFGVGDLVNAGITDVKTLKDAGFNDATAIKTALGETNAKGISDYKSAGFTAKDLKGLFKDAELIDLFDAKALKDAQFTASELKGKFNILQLKDAGYTLPQLKDAFKASEFGAGGISYADARTVFTAQQLKNVTQYAKQAAAELQPKVSQGRDLAYGSQGSDVKLLQQTLNKLGIRDNSGNSLDVDGDFGQHTREAVINFQKKYRNKASKTLSADGVVGYYTKEAFRALGYKTGGLADYTGPAWLDGTPSKPELVLNATDTKNFLALRDVLSSAMKSTSSVANAYGGNATYEININVDKLTSDYDVDRVAERVKKIIVKDSSYRNVTQVRNFR